MDQIIFFGGGKLLFSIITLLKKKKNIDILVFSSKRHLSEKIEGNKSLKNLLQEKKCNCIKTEKVNLNLIKKQIKFKNFIGVSIGSSWIFKDDIINFFKRKIYNIHGSNLPEDKGGGGFTWQILQKKTLGYISIHHLTPKIDEGNIILKSFFKLTNKTTPLDINNLYVLKASKLFIEFLSKIKMRKKIKEIKQNKDNSSYWPRLNTETHGWINWDWTGDEIYTFLRGFDDPYPGAHTTINGNKVYLKKGKLNKKFKFHPFQYGLIFRKNKYGLWICVKNGCLVVEKVLDNNKKPYNKKLIKLGDRFYTPHIYLEKAKKQRVYFHLK